jgi:Phytanoyl-CoA dioxygenase (PhyH)
MATSARLASRFRRPRPGMVEADRLVRRGQLVEAVDLLTSVYRTDPEPDLAIRLRDLRHAATSSFDVGPGRTPWPPGYDDPFPDVSGRVPEIGRAELTTDVLGGAVAHHGALVVRGLFDDDMVARSVEAIHRTQDERERGSANGWGTAWYRPFASPQKRDEGLRRMVAEQGGTWLADSPAGTAQVLDDLASTGAIDVISRHFGERPSFSLQKSTLRRSRPKVKLVAWHQDGSFLDRGVRTMNVWLALSRCGGDYPAPGLEVVPRRMPEVLPVDGELTPHSISFDLIEQVATETPIIRPEFGPGDALMFDERLIHRTYLDHSMTEYRYALECWFFAPSHRSTGYVPFLV